MLLFFSCNISYCACFILQKRVRRQGLSHHCANCHMAFAQLSHFSQCALFATGEMLRKLPVGLQSPAFFSKQFLFRTCAEVKNVCNFVCNAIVTPFPLTLFEGSAILITSERGRGHGVRSVFRQDVRWVSGWDVQRPFRAGFPQ